MFAVRSVRVRVRASVIELRFSEEFLCCELRTYNYTIGGIVGAMLLAGSFLRLFPHHFPVTGTRVTDQIMECICQPNITNLGSVR